jgi:hypothetical protein
VVVLGFKVSISLNSLVLDIAEIESYEKLDFLNILKENDLDYYNKEN